MYFSPAFVLAALTFLGPAASLESDRRNGNNGMSIPITKYSGSRNPDGVFGIAKLQAGIRHTCAKIQSGVEAFERNTDSAHPSASQLKRSIKRGNSDPLTDDNAQLWYGSITVGTPAVTFTVVVDTGSSDLFLPGSGCDSTCDGHTLYNPSASSTSSDVSQTFKIDYGSSNTSASVSGEQYTDIVTLAGYKATGQRLGAAKIYSGLLQSGQFPADGLLGMGYESISSYGASPVFQTLVSQGQVSTPEFGFYLAESGSELYIGGTNQNHYTGSFTYMPVTTQGFWQCSFDGISVNGKSVIGNSSAVIDTGTTQVIGDTQSVQAIYDQIPDSQDAGDGIWTIPCDFDTPVSMLFSGKAFQISPSTFNLGPESSGSSTCIGGIGYFDASDNPGFWVVGEAFLQNVYSVFDFGNNRVGFAYLS